MLNETCDVSGKCILVVYQKKKGFVYIDGVYREEGYMVYQGNVYLWFIRKQKCWLRYIEQCIGDLWCIKEMYTCGVSEENGGLDVCTGDLKIQKRFKCIYSDINVQRYLSRRLTLRPFMITSRGATLNIIYRLI